MVEIGVIFWYAVQIAVGYHLVLPVVLYVASLFKAGTLGKASPSDETTIAGEADYAVIVTAYRYTDLLSEVVDSLLNMNYIRYKVYVVADNCSPVQLRIDDPRVVILYPEEKLASNVRSHFYAMDRFTRNHDRLTIIDSDNIVHPEYLNELNRFFDQGYLAVQGIRLPKNLDTTFACLDAARDIYYHFYDAKILFRLGSSATLSGSGMAFTVGFYRDCLSSAEPNGAGFDKVLQAEIVRRNQRIAFTEKAIVYDAKTSKAGELVSQRSRWIGTWFKYHLLGFKLLAAGLYALRRNQALFGLILLRPPLFIFLILSVVILVINWGIGSALAWAWAIAMVLFVLGFAIALFESKSDKRIYRSLAGIPRFMLLQVLALFRVVLNRQSSISTNHS